MSVINSEVGEGHLHLEEFRGLISAFSDGEERPLRVPVMSNLLQAQTRHTHHSFLLRPSRIPDIEFNIVNVGEFELHPLAEKLRNNIRNMQGSAGVRQRTVGVIMLAGSSMSLNVSDELWLDTGIGFFSYLAS